MNQSLIAQLLTAALQEAQRQGVPVIVTLVDPGGHVLAVQREAACSYFALASSRQKAVTASQLRMPSHAVGELSQKIPLLEASFRANPEITGLPGGYPVRWQGAVVGGLGVGGGNFGQDRSIAEAALAPISPAELSKPAPE